jgi:hypothetical protein
MEKIKLEDVLSSYYFTKEITSEYDKKKLLIDKYKEELFDEQIDLNEIEDDMFFTAITTVHETNYICLYYYMVGNKCRITVEAIPLDYIDLGMIGQIEKRLGINNK